MTDTGVGEQSEGNRWAQFTEAEVTVIQASLAHVTGAIIEEAIAGSIPEENRADAAISFAAGVPLMLEISAHRGEVVPSVESVKTLAASIVNGTTAQLAEIDDPDPEPAEAELPEAA